jgi:hypothetical protein
MKRLFAGIMALALVAAADTASAWGSQGHQLVGSIADRLLTDNARAHVQHDLGLSLQVAATWPDCVRAVGQVKGKFVYKADPRFATWCKVFETTAGKSRMRDYAKRNWRQCVDDDPKRVCNAKYHYADVAVQHDHYQLGQMGTNDHDVAHAIEAAIQKLDGKPVSAPFDIKDNKEALLLLAHFVGDIHQPLHMGAVYLDQTGALLDPDAVGGDVSADKTQGGNSIMNGGDNLHSQWDGILASLGTTARDALVEEARQVPATAGDYHAWPEAWATDTVLASQTAFAGLEFGPPKAFVVNHRTVTAWPVTARPPSYSQAVVRPLQEAQLVKAGKRLADLLNAIWP